MVNMAVHLKSIHTERTVWRFWIATNKLRIFFIQAPINQYLIYIN